MDRFCQTISVHGRVDSTDVKDASFVLELLSGDKLTIDVSPTTYYEVLRNVGDVWRDRVEPPTSDELGTALAGTPKDRLQDARKKIVQYLEKDRFVTVTGIYASNGDCLSFSARRVVLMHNKPQRFGWEDTHWWLSQVNTLFEQWLDALFEDKRQFTPNDFAEFYRTELNLVGGGTGSTRQECATMSRFLYGLSSSYLLTGNERALSAATACAYYLVEAFTELAHDRQYCFWKFARERNGNSVRDIVPSENQDDLHSYALYEQIYALSGLAQYYRITQDTRILGFLTKTIAAFEDFFSDQSRRPDDRCFEGKGGYFSHIDTVTMRPDSPVLASGGVDNVRKKNWNSVGDHVPAYLINLILALDPLPNSEEGKRLEPLLRRCKGMLDHCVDMILEHFFDDENKTPFVFERFDADWKPDRTWFWQQDRGIVGHNLKIAWNLTRVGHYYATCASRLQGHEASKYDERANKCYERARYLGDKMAQVGVDLVRGGIWDALERTPNEHGEHEFAWGSNKDFWQQEQAILAYYILHGIPDDANEPRRDRYLQLGRACSAFWNQFFLDHDNRKIHFRTDDNGNPIIQGSYGAQAGHAIAGYHAFELNYLAHVYIRTYVSNGTDDSFTLTFRPQSTAMGSINVLPDFMRPHEVEINTVRVDGIEVGISDSTSFQIDIRDYAAGAVIEVEFRPVGRGDAQTHDDISRSRPAANALCRKA